MGQFKFVKTQAHGESRALFSYKLRLFWSLFARTRRQTDDLWPAARSAQDRLPFALYVRNDNRRPKRVKLTATCGALDMDDPQAAITVMLPDED